SASGFNVRLRQWRFSAANRRTASEIAGIFTNGRLLLPKSHGAHTIECARLHPEEWKMAKLIEHGLSFTEQRPDGSHKLGKRAVVIGPGIGGLATAGALAQYFEHVDILERDRLAAAAGSAPAWPARRRPSRARSDLPRFRERSRRSRRRPGRVRARRSVRAARCRRAAEAGFRNINTVRNAAADRAGAAA